MSVKPAYDPLPPPAPDGRLNRWNESRAGKLYNGPGNQLDHLPGAGMAGHLTEQSLLTALDALGLDRDSVFWDFGCSTGYVVAFAAEIYAVKSAGGCEINRSTYEACKRLLPANRGIVWHGNRCPIDITHAYAFWTGFDTKEDTWRRMRDAGCVRVILIDRVEGHREFERSRVIFPTGVDKSGWTREILPGEFTQSGGGGKYQARLWYRTPEAAAHAIAEAEKHYRGMYPNALPQLEPYTKMAPLIVHTNVRPQERGGWQSSKWESEHGLKRWHDNFEIKAILGKGMGVMSKVYLEPSTYAWFEALVPLSNRGSNRTLSRYKELVASNEENRYRAIHRPGNRNPLNLAVNGSVGGADNLGNAQLWWCNDHDYFNGANVKVELINNITAIAKLTPVQKMQVLELRRQAAGSHGVDTDQVVFIGVRAILPIYPGDEVIWNYNSEGVGEWNGGDDERSPKRQRLRRAFVDLVVARSPAEGAATSTCVYGCPCLGSNPYHAVASGERLGVLVPRPRHLGPRLHGRL